MIENDEDGFFISDYVWQALCERAALFCPHCGEHPTADDLETFADEGLCTYCSDEAKRWFRE